MQSNLSANTSAGRWGKGPHLNSEGLDSCAPAHLKLACLPAYSLLPSSLYFHVADPSAPLKLGRVPALTHVLPPTSTSRFCPSMSLAPPRLHSRRYSSRLCLDHSHRPVLAPGRADLHSLAALLSTRAIETHSLPTLVRCYPCSFTFYVTFPKSSIPSIATCSMSLIPLTLSLPLSRPLG